MDAGSKESLYFCVGGLAARGQRDGKELRGSAEMMEDCVRKEFKRNMGSARWMQQKRVTIFW